MEETGTVVKIEDKKAYVSVERKTGCETCPASGICKPSDEGLIIEAVNVVDAKIGDKVTVLLKPYTYLKGSLIVYGIPAVALIIGAVVGKEFLPLIINLDPEILSAVGGLFLFVVSFLIVNLYTRMSSGKKEFTPVIVKIIE